MLPLWMFHFGIMFVALGWTYFDTFRGQQRNGQPRGSASNVPLTP